MRIASLIPGATELLSALGLDEQIVAVSHECDYPAAVRDKPRVTYSAIPAHASSAEIDVAVKASVEQGESLYSLDVPLLDSLEPDLLVTQSLCGVCAVSEGTVENVARQLRSHPKVLRLEPNSLHGLWESMALLAETVGHQQQGKAAVDKCRSAIADIETRSQAITSRPKVALLEWLDPVFSSGHWNPELVTIAGGTEVLGKPGEASRGLHWDEVLSRNPDVLFIACCGYTVEQTLADLPKLQQLKGYDSISRVYVADGSAYFNRPGPRLVDSLQILAHALHPQVHPLPEHLEPAVKV